MHRCVLAFGLVLMCLSPAQATEQARLSSPDEAPHTIALQKSSSSVSTSAYVQPIIVEYTSTEGEVYSQREAAFLQAQRLQSKEQSIQRFFKKKLRLQKDETALAAEIERLAIYFAKFPSVYQLITRLDSQPLQLQYQQGQFRTEVRGNKLQVKSVKIFFDPYLMATVMGDELMMSAADALLHELLHAEKALLEPQQFIASGAMNSSFYPHQHEMEVIERERQLFNAMTELDGLERPQRFSHAGQLRVAACATCL